jgi:hypothetical protein
VRIEITKWEEFQHFKERDPIWIKLYRELRNKREWRMLPPAEAKCLVDIWMLASEQPEPGVIDLSIEDIAWEVRAKAPEVHCWLLVLKGHRFITITEGYQSDISTVSLARSREVEVEREKETEIEPRERKAKKRKMALPSDWLPNEGHHSQAKRDGLNVELECDQFRDHHTAKGSVMLDWDAAFRTWLRNAKKFQARDSRRPDESATAAIMDRTAVEWQAHKRATEARIAAETERLTKAAAVRNGSPSTAKEPSGPLAGVLARVVGNTLPPEAA